MEHDDHRPQVDAEPKTKMSEKKYLKELKRLDEELVKLQLWVVEKGLKVCIVFEGRDGAGKGGTIKAITERVSPRVFRVVALPAPPSARKRRCTAAIHAAPAGRRRDRDLRSQLVQPRRRRARHGLHGWEEVKKFLQVVPRSRRWSSSPASS